MSSTAGLLQAAGRHGIAPSELWEMTPRELAAWIEGAGDAEEARRIFTAAMTAALLRPHAKGPLRWSDLYRPARGRAYGEDEEKALRQLMEAAERARRAAGDDG